MYLFIIILILLLMLAKKEGLTILPNDPWDYSNGESPDTLYYLENDGRKGNFYDNVAPVYTTVKSPPKKRDHFYCIVNKLELYK